MCGVSAEEKTRHWVKQLLESLGSVWDHPYFLGGETEVWDMPVCSRACPLSPHLLGNWVEGWACDLPTWTHTQRPESLGEEGGREAEEEERDDGVSEAPCALSGGAWAPHLVVAVGVIGDGKDGDNVVFGEQAHQRWHRRVVLCLVLGVGACGIQVALLVIAAHDAGQHVGTVGLIVKG